VLVRHRRSEPVCAASDRKGRLSEVAAVNPQVEVSSESVEEEGAGLYTYPVILVMRQGEQKVVFTLRDNVTGVSSQLVHTLTIE
jgi:hypothetical protein